MFCENCGNQVPDEMTKCPNCGADVVAPAEASVEAPAQAPVEAVVAPAANPLNLKAIIAIAVAAIIVIIAGIAIFGGGSKESVAKKYAKASIEGDMLKAQKYCVVKGQKLDNESLKAYCEEEEMSKKEAFEEVEEEYEDMLEYMDMDMKVSIKSIKDIYKFYEDVTEERYKEEYGKYKIKVEVDDCEKLKKSELKDKVEDFEESLEYSLDETDKDVEDFFDADKVKEGYEVTIEYEIDGKDDDFDGERTITVVKYKGKWRVLTTGSVM